MTECFSCKSGTRHTVGIHPINMVPGGQFTVKSLQMNSLKTSILLLSSSESLIIDRRNL